MPTSMATLCVKRVAMLLTAHAVLQDEKRWVQGHFAGRNRVGPREFMMTNAFNPEAECFCAMGAMGKSLVKLTNDQSGMYDAALLSDPAVKVAEVALACCIKGCAGDFSNRAGDFSNRDFVKTGWTDVVIAKYNDDEATHESLQAMLTSAAELLAVHIVKAYPTSELLAQAVMQQMGEKNAHIAGVETLEVQLMTSQMWSEASAFVHDLPFAEAAYGKDPDKMTVAELREEGYCVIMWTPAEMGSASHSDLEDIVIQRGNEYLENNSGEEAEGEQE